LITSRPNVAKHNLQVLYPNTLEDYVYGIHNMS